MSKSFNTHVLYTNEDFKGEDADSTLYDLVVEKGLDICVNCGRGESDLDINCQVPHGSKVQPRLSDGE